MDRPEPKRPDPKTCKHVYHCTGRSGMVLYYECHRCGDEYDKDVS